MSKRRKSIFSIVGSTIADIFYVREFLAAIDPKRRYDPSQFGQADRNLQIRGCAYVIGAIFLTVVLGAIGLIRLFGAS